MVPHDSKSDLPLVNSDNKPPYTISILELLIYYVFDRRNHALAFDVANV